MSDVDYSFVTDAKFRFQCDASANNDKVYIDKVIMSGTGSSVSNLRQQNSELASTKLPLLEKAVAEKTFFTPKQVQKGTDLSINTLNQFESITIKENAFHVRLFPNPTNNYFKLKIQSGTELQQVNIFNFNGRLVKSFSSFDGQYNISDLFNGIYLAEIININGTKEYVKLVKRE